MLYSPTTKKDPCAGIGTINIRASLQAHYGIGGEIVPSLFQEHAPYFLDCNRIFQNSQRRGVVDMNGWDATMLPLRDSFVDAIVSDIPFGTQHYSILVLLSIPGLLICFLCAPRSKMSDT